MSRIFVKGVAEEFDRKLDILSAEVSKLHAYTVPAITRIQTQLSLLNQKLYTLNRDTYHGGCSVPVDSFNGQFSKHKIYADLCTVFNFEAFIETGAYHGKTTQFLAQSGKPVYSVEINDEYYEVARKSVHKFPNMKFYHGSSQDFLGKILTEILPQKGVIFIYLDAHWYDHLPLQEELSIIADQYPNAVVMIDDFKIDDDDGYGYDHYDEENEISLAFLQEEMRQNKWDAFFPVLPSSQDHMFGDVIEPRGTAVFSLAPDIIRALRAIPSLRSWSVNVASVHDKKIAGIK